MKRQILNTLQRFSGWMVLLQLRQMGTSFWASISTSVKWDGKLYPLRGQFRDLKWHASELVFSINKVLYSCKRLTIDYARPGMVNRLSSNLSDSSPQAQLLFFAHFSENKEIQVGSLICFFFLGTGFPPLERQVNNNFGNFCVCGAGN